VAKAKEKELLVPSPNPLPRPAEGDPELGMGRLRTFRDNPGDAAAERFAAELLERCGPLVLDGKQYRLKAGRVEAIPTDMLGLIRQREVAEQAAAAQRSMRATVEG
jgi:hypothetical protein